MDNQTPFSISPNPLSMFLTNSVKTVLNKVRFVINKRQGLTCILGDVGLGKSTLLRLLQAEYGAREEVVIVALPTPEYKSNFALMRAVCSELGMPTKRSLHEQLTLFQTYLLDQHEAGKTVILFIDEAQKLRPEMLELCRTLLNFETYEAKLIQIVLAGQLELRDALLDKKNRALYKRVFAPSLIAPLTLEETREVIKHRCSFYGIENPFPTETTEFIYLYTNGVPRDVLMICAESYDIMLATKRASVTVDLIEGLVQERLHEDE